MDSGYSIVSAKTNKAAAYIVAKWYITEIQKTPLQILDDPLEIIQNNPDWPIICTKNRVGVKIQFLGHGTYAPEKSLTYRQVQFLVWNLSVKTKVPLEKFKFEQHWGEM